MGRRVLPIKSKIMTKKEFDTLTEGDEIIFQKMGDLNGQTAIVYGLNHNGTIVYKYNGVLQVADYKRFKKIK